MLNSEHLFAVLGGNLKVTSRGIFCLYSVEHILNLLVLEGVLSSLLLIKPEYFLLFAIGAFNSVLIT